MLWFNSIWKSLVWFFECLVFTRCFFNYLSTLHSWKLISLNTELCFKCEKLHGKPVFVHTLLQYCTMLIHCSLACFSSRILLDSTGILFWRFIILLGLVEGEGWEASLWLAPLSLFEPHALHIVAFDGLTRVHVGQGQPGFTTPEPLKLVIKLITITIK